MFTDPAEAVAAGEFTRIMTEATKHEPTRHRWTSLGLALLMLGADRPGWAALARARR